MRIITIILPLLLLAGCDGHYRYPCQDPANWGKTECNNEVCKAEGTCTSDVLAPAGTREFGLTNQSQSTDSEENTLTDSESEISTDTCSKPIEQAEYVDNSKQVDFRVKRIEVPKDKIEPVVMDPEGDEYETPSRTPPSMEEPLTMNTVVDTAAHNAATK